MLRIAHLYPLILSYHEIASITIEGDLRGTVGSTGDIVAASVVALNQSAGLTTNLAIGKVTIGGTVERANIFAGTGPGSFSTGTNGNASIGAVKIGGDWIASNLVAGVKDSNADGFGNADDDVPNTPAGAEADEFIARIASISIGGALAGTPSGAARFGFVAQEIGFLKIGGRPMLLDPGISNDDFNLSLTGDVQLREV